MTSYPTDLTHHLRNRRPAEPPRLLVTVAHAAADPVECFDLPVDRTISMGGRVER